MLIEEDTEEARLSAEKQREYSERVERQRLADLAGHPLQVLYQCRKPNIEIMLFVSEFGSFCDVNEATVFYHADFSRIFSLPQLYLDVTYIFLGCLSRRKWNHARALRGIRAYSLTIARIGRTDLTWPKRTAGRDTPDFEVSARQIELNLCK